MRRLKVNKKSLLQKGGTPAPKVSMDTDTILQDIREKVQGGVSEVEIFQNLMEQQIPLDEIQTAFTALGYDETMLSNIMQAIQQSASVQEEPIGEVQGSELPKASTGFFGGNPAFSGTLGTYHQSPDGFMPAKGFYLPQDLGNRGNIFGALSTAAEAFNTLFSGKDLNNDGVADGSLRNFGVKSRRHKDNKGSYYTYDVEYDPNDTNTYNLNPSDLYKGELRTNEQYTQDLLDNSMINYNVNTGQYETLLSADEIKKNRFTINDPNREILKGRSFKDFYTTLKDNPAHLEMLAQQIGLIKDDYLPAGVSYGVDKDGVGASYFGANPYLYETMMGINVATGDKSREYTKDDLNTNPYRISTGGLQNNVGLSFTNTPSNTNTSSGFDYSNSPVVNKDDFVQGRQYTPLSSLTGNPSDKGFIDTTDYIQGNQTSTSSAVSSSAPVNITNNPANPLSPSDKFFNPYATKNFQPVTYTLQDGTTKTYKTADDLYKGIIDPSMSYVDAERLFEAGYGRIDNNQFTQLTSYVDPTMGHYKAADNYLTSPDQVTNWVTGKPAIYKQYGLKTGAPKRGIQTDVPGFANASQPVQDILRMVHFNTGIDPRVFVADASGAFGDNTGRSRGNYSVANDPTNLGDIGSIYTEDMLKNVDPQKLLNSVNSIYRSLVANTAELSGQNPSYAKRIQFLADRYGLQVPTNTYTPAFKSGGGGAGRGPAVASNRHTSQNSVSTGIDNSIGNPGDRTDYNQQQGDLDFSMFQAQEGGGFFDNFDFKGYFKGEQGLIPDYKGESTTTTVNNAVDKYGDAVSTGLDVMQTGMTAAGMVPVVGNVVDLANTGVSGVRSAYAGFTGDTDGAIKHAENAVINAASAIPGVGIGVGGAGLVKDVAGYTGVMNDKSIASNVGIKTERPLVDSPIETTPKKTVASMGYELPVYQAKGEIGETDMLQGEDLWLQEMNNQISNPAPPPSIYDLVVSGDLPRLEGRVNEELGGTMTRGSRITDIPGYKRYKEAESKFFESDIYQNLLDQINSEYAKDEPDEDKIDNLSNEITSIEKKFYDSEIGKMGSDMQRFYFDNEDPLRHATTSGLTARAISDKIKNVPYIGGLLDFVGADDVAGVIGANLLGLGHEVSAYMDYGKTDGRSFMTNLKESGLDMYNNFLGSLASIGSDSDEEVARKVIAGVKAGDYTSGMVPVALPNKQDGGATTLYEYYQDAGVELPSVAERRPAFQEAFGENAPYTGTAAQNTQFLEYLQSTDNPAPSSNTNIPNTETPVEEVSTPDASTTNNIPDFIGPIFNPNANQTNSGFPDADGDGIPDTIDIDAGTGTGESVVGDDITQTEPYVPPSEDPEIKKPKVKRRNKLAGTVNRIMDSPGMQAFGDVSGALVAGANVVNAFFDERNYNKAKEDLVFMGMADKAYGMYEERDGDRGNFDENTGLMQPDNMRGYMARMGKETFMLPPKMQEENIVDLDYQTVAKLISAGADIEIL